MMLSRESVPRTHRHLKFELVFCHSDGKPFTQSAIEAALRFGCKRAIAGELAKLGHEVSKDTVAKYMSKRNGRPGRLRSTTWAAFLRTHVAGALAIDFLTVPTVSFSVLCVFFVLSLERRRILHVNVTAHPHAAWAAQQMVEAVGFDRMLSRVIRDRDGIYGKVFDARVAHLGIEQLLIAPRSPWQNGYAERFMSLNRDAPVTRAVEPVGSGRVVAIPRIGAIHHRYARAA